jgi:hypothetical protein
MNAVSTAGLTLLILMVGALMVALPYAAKHLGAAPHHPIALSLTSRRLASVVRRLLIWHRYPELGGYVHDTHMSQFVPFSLFSFSAGTWTATVASNVWFSRRTAADASNTIRIPVLLPSNSSGSKGAYLQSVDVFFRVGTAALDALDAALYKMTLPADGSLQTVASVTTTYDTGHDTAAERIDVDEHSLTLSLSTPVWVDNDEEFFVEIVADAAATSVLDLFGARANFTLRL